MEQRPLWRSIGRGAAMRCPKCGEGAIFSGYLKVRSNCAHCGEQLDGHRADDMPPYFTILLVGKLLIPLLALVEIEYTPPLAVSMIMWPTLAVVLGLAFIRPVKGAIIGMQWAQRVHGFAAHEDAAPQDPGMRPETP